jgi:tetratricopeptide (TPR) repeat protein
MKTSSPALVLAALLLLAGPAPAAEGAAAQGIEHFSAGRIVEAKKLLEPYAKAHPKNAEAAYYLGRCWFAQRDFGQAVEWLEKASGLAPKNAEYSMWLGRAYGRAAAAAGMLKAMGLGKKSKEAMERAVSLDPNLLDARSDMLQFYLLAPGIMGGSVEEAKKQAAEIAKRDAARGAVAHANVAMHEKDVAGAIRLLEAALAKTPADARLRLSLGQIFATEERWNDAFAAYDAILAGDGGHRGALYQIGRTAALSGQRLEQGKAALERFIAGSPGPEEPPLANAHYRLGMVLERQGNKAAARAEYQAALRLDPKLDDAKKALDKLG